MKIMIAVEVCAARSVVWRHWTNPDAIKQWNNASVDWHTTHVENDLRLGEKFTYRMKAKDGSAGFDFSGTYTRLVDQKLIEYELDDDRRVTIHFSESKGATMVEQTFDADNTHSADQQRAGWLAILGNFKKYVEAVI